MMTIITILLTLAVMCIIMAINSIKTEKKKKLSRKQRRYSCVPWDADTNIKAFLDTNKSSNKQYKLAALVVEDENGHKYIEDIDLRGDSAEEIKLSQFATNRRTKNKADWFLFDRWIVDAIAQKVNCCIGDTERYYAFQITKENIESGRHGKTKKKILKDYVMLMDLDQSELIKIANLSI